MRRTLYWFVPLSIAVVATILFAAGFTTFLRGDIGTPVAPARQHAGATEPPRGTIAPIVLGDSLARGTGDETGLGIGGRLAADLSQMHAAQRPVVNLAVNGARTTDLLRQLESSSVRTLITESNVVIVSIGGNDLWGPEANARTRPRDPAPLMHDVLDRVARAVGIVRAANPHARIFVIGLYNPFARAPFGARLGTLVAQWNASLIDRFALDGNVTIVQTSDLFSHRARLSLDEFHPNDEGYALIAKRIADSL